MSEPLRDSSGDGANLESTTVGIYRTSAVVKGGRRFSFGALVVVGDRNGTVGLGYGKGRGVPAAIEKAQKDARKHLMKIKRNGTTIPHPVQGRFGASKVRLIPAAPGTGVIAGGTVRAVLEMAGINDCLSKSFGSTNQKNLTKAVLDGLLSVQTREKVNELRGVEIATTVVDDKIAIGQKFVVKTGPVVEPLVVTPLPEAPAVEAAAPEAAPANEVAPANEADSSASAPAASADPPADPPAAAPPAAE